MRKWLAAPIEGNYATQRQKAHLGLGGLRSNATVCSELTQNLDRSNNSSQNPSQPISECNIRVRRLGLGPGRAKAGTPTPARYGSYGRCSVTPSVTPLASA
jgi:hypothetical protein